MRNAKALLSAAIVIASAAIADAYQSHNVYQSSGFDPALSIFAERPDDCPPCFNCNLADFRCHQFANCTAATGRCSCPAGWGGEDCTDPLCGSLAGGKDRPPRKGDSCDCDDGWDGINCNMCTSNNVCNALVPGGEGGLCYTGGMVVRQNYQQCDVTNKQILDQLKGQKPQVTFSCDAMDETCNFQFWVDQRESFYCGLTNCTAGVELLDDYSNKTSYECEKINCRCVPGRMLCGENGSIDLGDFLEEEIKGPASFTTIMSEGGASDDGSEFSEPAMNDLISSVFGDKKIFLQCNAGECIHESEVPGHERPVKTINTPLIAGIIAGCALFIVAVVLLVYYFSRRQSWGPIHLPDEDDDEAGKLMLDHKPASLAFRDVAYNLKGKEIIHDIQGVVHPGELMAIMGASGAGKTTFLDVLARKNKRGTTYGEFFINGETIADDDFRKVIGFVDQDDTLLPTLTVHETIVDSAMLRLPKDMGISAKMQRVDDVERQLGIHHIRHQLIGSEEGSGRGISGGEKRRVGIACELVTSPSILFLDEPTSGLDSYNAFNVVECLVNLVKNYNRTVVMTIHQPRSNIVALFDQLVLLAQGHVVYSGPFSSCQQYFDSIGFSCPPGFNIADYLVDLTMHAGTPRDPIEDSGSLYNPAEHMTRASSTMAVKSIRSASNIDGDSIGSPADREPLLRPSTKRKLSVRQQQERQLFSRRKNSGVPASTASRTDDEVSLPDDHQQWLRLQTQRGAPPGFNLDDPDATPPLADDTTGTDLDILIAKYRGSQVSSTILEDMENAITSANTANGNPNPDIVTNGNNSKVKGFTRLGLLGQFRILSVRTWRNLYRNPMLMLTHYAIAIVLAVFLGFLFFNLTDDIKGFQNRLGLFFFLLALFGFSTLTSLTVFANERLLFMRERAKGYYSPVSYFAAKVIFDIIPLRLMPPLIMGAIVYPMTGLIPSWPQFSYFILFLVLFNLAAAAICLFIGIIFSNGAVANLIGSLVMLFSLLFSGFLLNHDTIPKAALWLQHLSIFHYGFEGLIVNEVSPLRLIDHKYGLDIEVPGAAILSSFGFNNNNKAIDATSLGIFCASFILLAYAAMHFLLVERR
ncbi:ABC-2 type transporter family protein [Microthyrium microscopicum]|uniref:ABC-2 type transporter family protein n=1 Tax=Microthyrium microscopicum TaxID=703497 RepID=A0A6A6U6D5_9PEZI|nr:ABC-2 type transporter family protein [Microthyrium microscopicum]